MEERQLFLDTYNSHVVGANEDSSDNSPDETRQFFKRDASAELTIGDKIYVVQGELQQANGTIVNFDDGGQTVIFKPTNIEGFDDSINLDRAMVVKYFEQGDRVRILEGKYQAELGIVTYVDENNVTMPKVKIESSDIEVSIPAAHLKLRSERDVDDIKAVNQRRKKTNPTVVPTATDKNIHDVFYRVGDIILFNANKL